MAASRLLREREVLERLNVSRPLLRKLREQGDLPVARLGQRALRYRPEDVEAFLERAVAMSRT